MLGPGQQATRIVQPAGVVQCGRDTCEWFRDGSAGMNGDGEVYQHPAGVRCGDMTRCKPCVNGASQSCGHCAPCRAGTANCPCMARLPHMGLFDRPEQFYVNRGLGERRVTFDEWDQRVAEGVDAIQFIRTRGL